MVKFIRPTRDGRRGGQLPEDLPTLVPIGSPDIGHTNPGLWRFRPIVVCTASGRNQMRNDLDPVFKIRKRTQPNVTGDRRRRHHPQPSPDGFQNRANAPVMPRSPAGAPAAFFGRRRRAAAKAFVVAQETIFRANGGIIVQKQFDRDGNLMQKTTDAFEIEMAQIVDMGLQRDFSRARQRGHHAPHSRAIVKPT